MASPRYARSGEVRICYALMTSWRTLRRPWLVLIQGLGFDRTGWEPILRPLCRRFRLVLIDNRGSGDSGPSPGRFGVPEMAADVIAVLDHARIPRAHVLGISLGGMIAQTVAAVYPERVAGLVLAATTPGFPAGYPAPRQTVALFAAGPFLSPGARRRRHVLNALAADTARLRPELVDQLVAHVTDHPGNPSGTSAQAAAGARFAAPGEIRARTLVLHGDADTVVDPRNARLLAGRIPGAELRIFPGLGHLLFWEDPAATSGAILGFLANS